MSTSRALRQVLLPVLMVGAVAGPASADRRIDEALLNRLLQVVPLGHTAEDADAADAVAETARLARLNPGRDEEIGAILSAGTACAKALDQPMATLVIRAAAADLGPAKIRRLIAFYEMPEASALRQLADAVHKGQKLKPEERAALLRAQAAYPLRQFGLAVRAEARKAARGGAPDYRPCLEARKTALEQAGLRTQ